MTRAGVAVLLLLLVGGCGRKDDAPAPEPPPVDAPLAQPSVTELPVYDPAAGHLDGLPESKEREAAPPPSKRNRNARMLGIVLRSTPSGAIAAVDGLPIGPTPAYWEGEFTGGEREFTFALANHGVARYRFVPTTNGVVHGHLEPIDSKPGAAVPPIPKPAPSTVPLRNNPSSSPASAPPSSPVTSPEPDDSHLEPAPSAPTTAPAASPAPPAGGTMPDGVPPASATPPAGDAAAPSGAAPSPPVTPPAVPAPASPAP